MGSFFRVVWLVMRKDLKVESRSWEILYTTLFFAMSCVLLFSFAFVRKGQPIEGAAAGILWIAVTFSGTLALGRVFERERHHDVLRGLMLAPIDRPAIFMGKLFGIVLLMAAVEVIVALMVALLFQAPLFAHPLYLLALFVAGTVGFATVGTLFAAMLVRTQNRGVLLPVVVYPLTVPVLLAGVGGTVALVQPEPNFDLVQFWLAVLVFLDVVLLTLALWIFEPVMTE